MKFIVIDGLDAAGKSTQALMLQKWLAQKGKTIHLRMHPSTDNFFGSKSKEFLYRKSLNAFLASAFFFILDVAHSVLTSFFRKYDYVIFVRYLMSSAYFPKNVYRIVYLFFSAIFPVPDCTFLLDVTPQEAYRRMGSRDKPEAFENMVQLQKVRAKILSLAQTSSWIVVDADQSPEIIQKRIRHAVQKTFLDAAPCCCGGPLR